MLQERLINKKTFATKSLRHEGKKKTTWEGRKKKENIKSRTRNIEYRREKEFMKLNTQLILMGYLSF